MIHEEFALCYFGPVLSGKRTNMRHIEERTRPEYRLGLTIRDSTDDSAIFEYRYAPQRARLAGEERQLSLRFMASIPFNPNPPTDLVVLRETDGVIFVADCIATRYEDNLGKFERLCTLLRTVGKEPADAIVAIQYNKRDLGSDDLVGRLRANLCAWKVSEVEAIALKGNNVMETVRLGVMTIRARRQGKERVASWLPLSVSGGS
jgi:hypothetical protein